MSEIIFQVKDYSIHCSKYHIQLLRKEFKLLHFLYQHQNRPFKPTILDAEFQQMGEALDR